MFISIIRIIITSLLTFFFTGIPTGFLIVKIVTGKDIRKIGSGNIGATNVKRVLGWKWFIFVLVTDALKGALPLLVWIFLNFSDFGIYGKIIITIFALCGNIFSPWLGFKGGKGVATSLGALTVLLPIPLLCSLGIFGLVLFLSRMISLASVVAAISFPFFVLFLKNEMIVFIFSVCVSLLIVLRHSENIKRIFKGDEKKFF